MNRISASIISALVCCAGLVGLQASAHAQECYRSTECDGNLVCVDKACVASQSPQTACAEESVCDWTELCDQGVCKPDGVTCTAAFGICTFDTKKTSCVCDDGEGFSASEPSVGAGDTEAPKTDEELYEQCAERAAGCGAAPDLNEVCTESQLTECTNLLTLVYAFEQDCGSADSTPVGPDGSTAESAAPVTAAATIDAEIPAYMTAQCCEWLSEISDDAPSACLDALSPDDCDGYDACMETFGFGDSASGEPDLGLENEDAEADDSDTETKDTSSKSDGDGGCRFAPNTGISDALSLILALL